MSNGWIPLWRKAIDNPVRRHDPTAWRVFETLLLVCDQKTGIWKGGRYQLAELDGSVKSETLYKALKRLEKAEMVTLVSNNKFSTISICNLVLLQPPSHNKVTTKSQQSHNKVTLLQQSTINNQQSTIGVVPKGTTSKTLKLDNRNPEITQLINHFETRVGKMQHLPQQTMAASELLKQYGFDRSIGAINAVVASRNQQYAPVIANLEDLRDKWVNLETFYQRTVIKNQPKGVKIR